MEQAEDKELALISGDFFDFDLPVDKRYLYKYFTTEMQQQFVRYYLIFGSHFYFREHTGYVCSRRWLKNMKNRLSALEDAKCYAKTHLDFDTLEKIEMGNYKA